MTREEAIEYLRWARPKKPYSLDKKKLQSSFDMAIKALEQEPVLDKIRAEIETEYGQCDICEYLEDYDYEENAISEYRPIGNIADVLQIIDKYNAEMRGKEDDELRRFEG